MRFFPSPAAAQQVGLRACRRCRPELAPDAVGNDPQSELASRALRLIDDGVGNGGVTDLAARLYVSPRHLQRVLVNTFGAGPAALVRMRRVRLARLMVDQTDLPLGRVAYAAGFGSVRQFNDSFKQTFHLTPGDVRRGRSPIDGQHAWITLPVRPPLDGDWILRWAALHAVPSRDRIEGDCWIRHTDDGPITLSPAPDGLRVGVDVDLMAGLRSAASLARQTFDLDADIDAIHAALGQGPLLGPLLRACPGVRIPGAAHPFEGAVRVILGQQVSAKGATTLMARLASQTDKPGLPDPRWVQDAPLETLIGLTRQRAGAVRALATAVHRGLDLSPGADHDKTVTNLLDLPGVGPWTAHTIALVVLRQPDAWPSGDLALRRAVEDLTGRTCSATDLDTMAARWRPWRGYAAMLLWRHYLDL